MEIEANPLAFENAEPFAPPIPESVAAPLKMVLAQLQGGCAVLLVKAEMPQAFQWLNVARLEAPLLLGPLECLRLEAWPILENTWAVALKLPQPLQEPLVPLQIQLARQALQQRLQTEWQQHSSEETLPFSILPITSLLLGDEQQNHLAELNTLLEVMVQGRLGVHFHPIVNLREARVAGYEALIRMPAQPAIKHTGELLQAVQHGSLIAWFDIACLERCFQEAGKQGLQQLLFVNLEAEGIMNLMAQDRPLLQRVYDSGLSPRQIVIEITERQAVQDFPGLLREIKRLQEDGFRIAIDDAGSGYNSLEIIAELLPDFIKLDRSLVRSLNSRGERRALVAALVRFAAQIGAKTLGEGVETPSELTVLINLGVQYAQGYLFGRPQETFHGVSRPIRELILTQVRRQEHLQTGCSLHVGALKQSGLSMIAGTPLLEAARRFAKNDGLTSIVVMQGGEVCGVLMRQTLASQLEMARQAQAESFLANETIERWMESKFVAIPEHLALDEAISHLTYRNAISLETDIVIVNAAGAYRGVLPVRLLLEAALQQHDNRTHHTCALTGLPDRLVLEQALQERLDANMSAGLVRVDIAALQAYNRDYGVAFGDALIVQVAERLRRASREHGAPTDQIFHLGGDNFVLLTQSAKVAVLCYVLANDDDTVEVDPPSEAEPASWSKSEKTSKKLHVVGLTLRRKAGAKPAQDTPPPSNARAALQALEKLLRELQRRPDISWAVDKIPSLLPKSA
ncbi:bifunctional diguanylate cyclase/phosphodiesterase [Chthonomonas calidirosea]|uniref:bifunctional diguanylate cyclase/phosphodiesterase n=1 Tax=Chthonomonas calidirosea TaxID=454171 RepID=UPI0006EC8A66|nr:GGDEF domain-containing protein [Chthonomonas calidirosea]CEK19190.1 EAL domain-containing protein [Chthonomonas calidirosea]